MASKTARTQNVDRPALDTRSEGAVLATKGNIVCDNTRSQAQADRIEVERDAVPGSGAYAGRPIIPGQYSDV